MTHLICTIVRNLALLVIDACDHLDPQLVVVFTPEEPAPVVYGTNDTTGDASHIQWFTTG